METPGKLPSMADSHNSLPS